MWGDDNRDSSIIGSDHLYGGEGNDKLFAGLGNDYLHGGTGHNLLDGDNGFDTYALFSKEFNGLTHNIIQDSDGFGRVLVDDVDLSTKTWRFDAKTERWQTDNLDIYLKESGSDLLIMSQLNIAAATIKDFKAGKLGLNIKTNQAPVAVSDNLADLAAMEGIAIHYALDNHLFTDEDVAGLTYEVTLADGSALPSWLRYDEQSKTISGVPKKDNIGQLALKVTAKDVEGLTTSINWNIVVAEKPNLAPIATVQSLTSPVFKENETITYTLPETLFKDDGEEPLTYQVQSANGEALPEWLTFNSKTRTLSGMPNFESAGSHALRIIATDSKGLSSSIAWQLEVSDTNRAPTAENSIPTQNITAKENWQYHLAVNRYFQDLDTDDKLSYSVTLSDGKPLPSWLHYDADTHTLSGNAPEKGQFQLAVTATDKAGETATQTLTVNVALPIVNGGHDTIVAGTANEILEGGAGSDTYVFGKQFGQDTVVNFNPNQQDKDVLRFTDTKLSEMKIQRNEADLVLTQKDGQRVIVQNFFDKDGKGDYTVQSIEFADGKTLNTEQLRQWVISPTTGNDKLYAYADGGKIYGGNGDDTFVGNTDVDYFVGGAGNDILQGGKNDDRLEGDAGNDTYLFNLGDGNDRIYDSFGKDTLKLGQDIAKQDLWFSRTGRDLTVQVLGQQDSITIEGWYNIIPRRIETIQSADGAYLDVKAVQQMVQAMANFAPQQASGLSVVEQMQAYSQHIVAVNNVWK